MKNVSVYKGYFARTSLNTYCCHKCSVSSAVNAEQHKQTCMEKYGVTSYAKTQECKQKIRNTSLDRYGVENGGGSEQALKKIRETNMSRYGVEYSFSRPEVREKAKQSVIKRYGVDNNMKSAVGLQEYQHALQKKYGNGIISNLQLESCRNKCRQTKLERYGNEFYVNADKIKATKLERYGTEKYHNAEKFKANYKKYRIPLRRGINCENNK